MMTTEDIEELGQKRVCSKCLGDGYLKDSTDAVSVDNPCSYCSSDAPTMSMRDLADKVRDAFAEHYQRSYAPSERFNFAGAFDDEDDVPSEMYVPPGEAAQEAIAMAAIVEPDIAEDVRLILEDEHDDFDAQAMGELTEFSDGTYYEIRDVSDGICRPNGCSSRTASRQRRASSTAPEPST